MPGGAGLQKSIRRVKQAQTMKWSKLKKVQDLKLIRSMYIWLLIVPLFAKIFQHVNDVARLTIFEYQFQISFSLPFTWELFYFSAVSLVIGNVIYYFRCPGIINDHSNFYDFKESGKSLSQLDGYATEINNKIDESSRSVATLKTQNRSEADKDLLQDEYWRVSDAADIFAKRSRFAVSAFYALGFILIAGVVIENSVWVLKLVFHL